jgi:hypothetical protein
MTPSEQSEIERLVSEVADEGLNAERIKRLDDLLGNRPDLQQHYSQAMTLHMLLGFELDLSMQQLQPIVSRVEQPQQRAIAAGSDHCTTLSTRISHDVTSLTGQLRRQAVLRRIFATVATVAALFVVYFMLSRPEPTQPAAVTTTIGSVKQREPVSEPAAAPEGLVVSDIQSLRTLSQLTRTASVASLLLPRRASGDDPGITLCSGTAWMQKTATQRERGYVVALQPGDRMDLFVYTDALYQNGLGVVELDEKGRMTGGALSFSNLEKGDPQTTRRRLGCIGNYSEFNDRNTPKYYLFTGSHRLPQQSPDELWRLSDFKVQFDSGDVMAIGWDDSGYIETENGLVQDRDFNDVRALVRFSHPGSSQQSKNSAVTYTPEIEQDMPLANQKGAGFTLDVKPGEILALLISSSADMQNSVRVVDDESRKIIWQDDGSPTTPSSMQAADRGVYVIRNFGSTVRRYEIQAQHVEQSISGRQIWEQSPYQVFADGDRSVIVGFEDSISVPANVDWNDIRVYARWFSD